MRARGTAIWVTLFCAGIPSGCSTVTRVADLEMPETTRYSYYGGKATQLFGYPKAAVKRAVTEAMDDLHMRVVRETHDGVVVFFEGRTADDRSMQVTLRPNQGATRVSVKIAWFGDEALSRAFTDRVGIRLGALPPEPIPEMVPEKAASPSVPSIFLPGGRGFDIDVLTRQAEDRLHDRETFP
jgi:hypothetical protein